MRTRWAILLGVVVLLAAACQLRSGGSASPTDPNIISAPDDPTKPYVITAIDYHFHDAHPTVDLDPSRAVVFSNQGSTVHNVSIPAIDYSMDIRPGERITIDALGEALGSAGTYELFCAYHIDRGMRGTIVIA